MLIEILKPMKLPGRQHLVSQHILNLVKDTVHQDFARESPTAGPLQPTARALSGLALTALC